MKLLIVRHGQSQDDVIDAYGGWADFPLTDTGKQQLQQTAEKIKSLGIKFDKIINSPLIRAQQSAEIISKELNVPTEVMEYLKERNTYGLMCGMVKSEAKTKYPWLVEAYENDKYVDGSERVEDINTRVKKAYELLSCMNCNNLLIVTHGNFMKQFFPIVFNKKLVKKEDGGFVLLEIEGSKVSVLKQEGLELE
jgi:broad specificity phosphatase PhoE